MQSAETRPQEYKSSSKTKLKTVIFLHIHKTAGRTIHDIMEREFPKSRIFTTDGIPWPVVTSKFNEFPEEKRDSFQAIKGHMPFGIHRSLNQPYSYFTFLREPINRTVSGYYYAKSVQHSGLYEKIRDENISLIELLESGRQIMADNGQVRILSGLNADYGCVSGEMFELAKKNLQEYMSVIGIVEEFDTSVILLRREFGWRIPLYAKKNVTKRRRSLNDLSSDELRYLKKYNEYDIELYEYGKRLFAEAIAAQPGIFIDELREFQIFNKLYNQLKQQKVL